MLSLAQRLPLNCDSRSPFFRHHKEAHPLEAVLQRDFGQKKWPHAVSRANRPLENELGGNGVFPLDRSACEAGLAHAVFEVYRSHLFGDGRL